MIESGVPGYVATSWTGLAAPPGTPPAIVAKLNAALNAGLGTPGLQAKLKKLQRQGSARHTLRPSPTSSPPKQPKWVAMVKLSGVATK